jgi:hypothetical protein
MIRSRVVAMPAGSGAPVRPINKYIEQSNLNMGGIRYMNSLIRVPTLKPFKLNLSQPELQRFKANQAY